MKITTKNRETTLSTITELNHPEIRFNNKYFFDVENSQCFTYDETTGNFKEVGFVEKGYRKVKAKIKLKGVFKKQNIPFSDLAMMAAGQLPKNFYSKRYRKKDGHSGRYYVIDHIDGDRYITPFRGKNELCVNDKLSNLRLVTTKQNNAFAHIKSVASAMKKDKIVLNEVKRVLVPNIRNK